LTGYQGILKKTIYLQFGEKNKINRNDSHNANFFHDKLDAF